MKYIDEMIQEAQKRGDFSNLDGEGKPLDLSENPYDKETRLAYNIVKKSGFTLGFIAQRKTLEALIEKELDTLARSARKHQRGPFAALRWQKSEDHFRQAAAEINRQIRSYNLKAPRQQFHLFPLDIEQEIARVRPG